MNPFKRSGIALAMVVGLAAGMAQATSGNWNADAADNWSVATRWTSTPTVPGTTAGDVIGLTYNITGARQVTIDTTPRTVGTLNIGDPTSGFGAYTLAASGGGTLTFDNSGLGAALNKTSASTAADTISAPIILNDNLAVTLTTHPLTISGVILETGGSRTLTKTGTGILTLSSGNPNQFTGNTVISNGKVALGAAWTLWQSAYDTTGSTGAIGLTATGYTTPWLGGLAGSVNLATAITGYSSITSLTLNPQTGSSVSYGGVIANGAANMTLNKSGHGSQTLTGANSYSGATTVWAGTLALAGASGTALNSAFTVRGGTLELDNSGGTFINRLTDGTALSLGSLTLKSFNGAGAQSETVGATAFAVGGKVTINNGTTGGDQTTLALGAVTRSAGAAIDFVGVNGTLGSGANSPNVTSTGAFPGTINGILPWATVNGTLWAEDNAGSVRAYSGTFEDPTSAASDATKNAQLTGSGTMASAKSFNSLNVIASSAGQSLSLGGTLTLTANNGGILKSGSDAYTISASSGNITAGNQLITHVDGGALTISAPLNTAIVNLAKGGTGDLILSGTRAGTMNGAISIAGGQLEFRGAGFTLSGVVTGAGGLTVNLNAGQTLKLDNNSNSYAGPTIVKGGYLSESGYSAVGLPGGRYQTPNTNPSFIMSNLRLQGGIWYSRYTTNKDLGAGPGQVQILAGTSGFVHDAGSGGAASIVLDGSRELVWGSTYFNPTVFVHSTIGNLTLNLANGFDLAGSTRTVLVGDATYNALAGGGASQLGGVIRTSIGTAGLTKTGVGILLLSGANTFNDVVTVSQGTLAFSGNANVASPNPLGLSSAAAANLLLANGTTLKYSGGAASTDRSFTINGTADGHSATLDASGTGAINYSTTTCPSFGTSGQTRTLILGGTWATTANTLAANLADNGAGALSVTKTGAALWALTGANTYTGTTTISGGLLAVSAANNLGASSANLVLDGGGLQINGTALTKLSDLNRTVVFTAGKTVTFNIADASNIFTVDQALTGVAGVTVTGAGKVLFNPPYTGPITIVSGTTLQYNDGPAISTAPLLNNGTLIVNRTGTDTQGTTFHSIMGGTGSLIKSNTGTLVLNGINIYTGTTKSTAGTLSLSHPMALMNSAVDTAGTAGAIALSGVTTPIFGGLTGTVAVATALTGYGSVTDLTLNPQVTYTYSGVIANGATGMSVTKIGAGTQILTGNNTYTGETYLNAGALHIGTGSTIGKISGTTGLTFNGGTLQFNRSSNADIDAINNAAPITVNISSTFGVTSQDAGGTSANENIGAATLNAGQMSFNWTNGGSSGTLMTLTSLSRSGTASANFNSGFASNNSRWKVTGAGTTTAGQIIGPWYTTGGNNAGFASTDYAVYSSDFVAQAAIVGSAENTWGTAANAYTMSANQTLTATRTITALRNTFATTPTLTLASGANLETYGLLNGANALLTVAPGTGGVLTTPTGGGNLYVNTGANAITVNAPINNNSGTVTLVKNGANTLTLGSTTSTYSGGTVMNAGNLSVSATANLSSGGLTFNGSASVLCSNGGLNGAWPITLNNGAIATFSPASGWDYQFFTTGAVTGNGGVYSYAGGGAGGPALRLLSTANTFTGPIYLGNASRNGWVIVNSLADSNSPIQFGYSNAGNGFRSGCNLVYHTGAIADLVLNMRYFVVSAASPVNGANAILNDSGKALTINTDLLVTATGSTTLTLGGTGAGLSTFAGKIVDGPGAVVSLNKSESGKWVLSGTNTFSGATTVSLGTLVLAGSQTLSDTAALTIASSGTRKVQLNDDVKEKVGSLVFGTATQAIGTWGSTSSDADNKNDTYFAVGFKGVLYVGIDPPPPPPSGTVILLK